MSTQFGLTTAQKADCFDIEFLINEFMYKGKNQSTILHLIKLTLNETEIDILEMHRKKTSRKEVANKYNTTPEEVRDIEKKALKKIKNKAKLLYHLNT